MNTRTLGFSLKTWALMLGLFVAAIATETQAQIGAAETLKVRKEVAKLERKAVSCMKKLKGFQKDLEQKQSTMKRHHARAFDADRQAKAGAALSKLLKGHCGLDTPVKTPEDILDEFGIDLRRAFGLDQAFSLASKRHLVEGIAGLMEEKMDPTVTRCARTINDAYAAAFGKDFKVAWKTLKKHSRLAQKVTKEQESYDKLVREKRDRVASLTSGIRGNIPRNMAVVPGAVDAYLGLTPDDINSLSEAEQEKPEHNFMLAYGSDTTKTTLATFLIDRCEVTHRAFWYFCTQTERDPDGWPQQYSMNRKIGKKEFSTIWPNGDVPSGWDNRPITWLRYEDMVDYCRWTNTHVPTEDEWEVAARSSETGFDGRFWPFQKSGYQKHLVNDAMAHDLAVRLGVKVPKNLELPAVIDVSALPSGASPLGIMHIVGNAAEMTSSPFVARPTFKTIKFSKNKRVTRDVFDSDKHVVRGGHCDSRSLLASAVMRFQADPYRRSKMIGFRRARSATPGQEVLTKLSDGGQLEARLQDYKLLRSEKAKELPRPQIDTDPKRYTAIEKFDWNEEYSVPGAARSILIANRRMDEISTEKALKSASDGDDEVAHSVLIGILHTDVPILEPMLEPGTWFVSYKKGWRYKDPQTKKKIIVPNRYIFRNKRSGIAPVSIRAKSQTTNSKLAGVTKFEISRAPVQKEGGKKIAKNKSFDMLSCIWTHKTRSRRGLVTEITLKLAPGALNGYK
ncbi:MAG: SUMF1/EgtB/PvdO family nonheme iron enzyme [Planctomycetota bacterium]